KLPVRLAALTDWSPSNARPIKIVRSLSTVPNFGGHSKGANLPRMAAPRRPLKNLSPVAADVSQLTSPRKPEVVQSRLTSAATSLTACQPRFFVSNYSERSELTEGIFRPAPFT